ncbi:MAG: hypothetical protein HY401_04080 [Elusimicrobia bacterium]|nr:hypothetical protein [Elusimicrobiota bacterium]
MSEDGYTTPERLSSLEAKTDRVLEEISILRSSFVELEKYMGNHAKDIAAMKVELNFFKTVGAWIFAPLLGLIGLGSVLAIVYALMR